jgi:hypothetical protein
MVLEIGRGITRSHGLENSLWKRLRTCRKTAYSMVVVVVMICKNEDKEFEDKITINPKKLATNI